MDPKLPEQRQQHIVQASGASLVIADKSGIEKAPWLLDRSDLLVEVDKVLANNVSSLSAAELNEKVANLLAPRTFTDQALAYLIYTSGSTGLPKGVRCHHGGAMNTILDLNSEFNVGPSDRVLGLSSLSFDLSVYDIFGMLEAGAALVIPPADAVSPPDPQQWLDLLHSEKVTIWNTVPRFMELMVSHVEQSNEKIPESLRVIFMSGDFIPLTLCKRIREACACSELRIVSMGGATEAAVWSNIHEVSAELDPTWSSIPYGRAMRNQRMYILDENLDHCAPWVTGVIYIGGLGVALGYQGDAERTAYQFIKHPRSGEYLFRTGDLGRVRPGSTSSSSSLLEILGREDSQVKVGGFRVELGEIERVAESFPGVVASCVIVSPIDPARPRLFAFITVDHSQIPVTDNASEDFPRALHVYLGSQLPPYMVPSAIEVLDKLPLNSNGKVDRGVLNKREPPPLVLDRRSALDDMDDNGESNTRREPRGPTESLLAEVWETVLEFPADSIGVDENFFDLGGDSITSLRIVAKARAVGIKVSVRQIFTHPTVASLAQVAVMSHSEESGLSDMNRLENVKEEEEEEEIVLNPDDESANLPFPLIGIQKAYWIGIQLNSAVTKPTRVSGSEEDDEDDVSDEVQPIIFNEFEVAKLDVPRLEAAWDLLIRRHDLLRSVLTENGELKVLKIPSSSSSSNSNEISQFHVTTVDLTEDGCTLTRAQQRDQSLSKPLSVYEWPLFECNAVKFYCDDEEGIVSNSHKWRIQVKLSLVLLDALSEMTLRRELEVLYDDLRALLPPIGMRFRDYAVAMTDGLAKTNAYRNDVEHWTSRLDSLALPPSIPLKPTLDSSLNQENKSVKGPAFMHLAGFVDRDQWGHFKRMCASHNMTPTAALASIYAQALGAWTTRDGKRDKRLLINVMHTTRLPLHRDVGNVFGNFSSTTLLDAVVDPSCAFRSNAAAVADQLAADLEHWRFGGVDVSRVLNTKRGSTLTAVAPFVFTSTLGLLKASLNPRGLCSHQSFTCVTTPHG
jgi:amino acid adenylation domain-containing protein